MEYIGTSEHDMGVIVKMGQGEWETLRLLAARLDFVARPGTMIDWQPMFRLLDCLAQQIGGRFDRADGPLGLNGATVTVTKSVTVGSVTIAEG